MKGELLGTASGRALVLSDSIASVDIESGEVRATANTAAEDPMPSFDRHLPRFDNGERETQPVDRLDSMPVYAGPEVVAFIRGTGEVVTSLVGLDATTLEQAWTLELAYKQSVRSCSTAAGVLIAPPPPDPARFVNWMGQQTWLREFGNPDEKVDDFACGEDEIVARLVDGKRNKRLRTFDAVTGDLKGEREDGELNVARAAVAHPDVRQDGAEVVGHSP